MIKMPLVTLGLLGSMVFGNCVQASTMLLESKIIGEDSVFIKGSFYHYSSDPKTDSEDLDPHIDVGMRFSDVVGAFKKTGSVGATFFESRIYEGGVSAEELEKLAIVSPYIYSLCLCDSSINDRSLEAVKRFTELRALNLTFNSMRTPSVEFFSHFPHLKEVNLDARWDAELEAVRELQVALPRIAFVHLDGSPIG
jgi:hypothetical protein